MKKRILSLALASVLTLALAPVAFAAEKPDSDFKFDDGSISTTVPVMDTEYEYLGGWLIEDLYRWDGEPWEWTFGVNIVDDSVETIVYNTYFTNLSPDLHIETTPGYFGVEDGKAIMSFDTGVEWLDANPTKESPYVYEYNLKNGWLFTQVFQRWDEDWEGQGYVGYAVIAITESQLAEFQKTGKLPPTNAYEDLTPYLDLTELKALLSGEVSSPSTPALPETPSAWAAEQVKKADELGLVPAELNGAYTQQITRAEFCALAVRLYETVNGAEVAERKTFADSADVNVQKIGALGVVAGVGNDRFNPDGTLTREQAAVILARLAEAVGKPLTGQAADFADNSSISSWAADGVGQVQAAEIMGGVGNNMFSPKGSYTREQSIITILRLYELVK